LARASRAASATAASGATSTASTCTWSIAALGMFNVTNQHTFAAIFQRDMGARATSPPARMVADMYWRI
jgi:hypothetical protein